MQKLSITVIVWVKTFECVQCVA